jgi:AraC family transcriptional regulator, transcriptional activator of the genes for pyochelin and ferripyochelin receptors
MKLSIPAGGEVLFNQHVPVELTRFKAPGAKIHAASGAYGTMLLQGLPPKDTKAWYGVFRIQKDTSFHVNTKSSGPSPLTKLRILLKNDQLMQVSGIGDVFLKEGQANIMYSPGNQYTLYYKKGKEYISLDVYYSLEVLSKWRSLFPSLEDFVARVETSRPALLSSTPLRLTASIFSIIHDLVNCPYDQLYHKLYFENKVSLLLFLLLVQTIQPLPDDDYNRENISSILRAKSIITKDEQFHYSIPEIATQVGLNEVKLKKGFKQVFGVGLYGFLMTTRMEKARELLESTSKPVNEISVLVGYKSTSSFIKLYKKRFGHSPYAWRRLQRKKSEV